MAAGVKLLKSAKRALAAASSRATPAGRRALKIFEEDPEALLRLPEHVLVRLAQGDVNAIADAAKHAARAPASQAVEGTGWLLPSSATVAAATLAGGAAARTEREKQRKDSAPEDLSDGLAGAPQDDITPEPMAGTPSKSAVYNYSPPQQAPAEEELPPATNWDRFGNPVYNEDPTPEPAGGWQPRPAGAGFGGYAAAMDQQLGPVQERTMKILLDAGIEPSRAARIVRGQLSMTQAERDAVVANGGLQQQRADAAMRARRDARMGVPPGATGSPNTQRRRTPSRDPRMPYGDESVDLGEATSERQGADESDWEYRYRMGTGMNANRRELDHIQNGGLPYSFDPGTLGENERLPSASSARPQSYANPNTFDPMAAANPRQAFRAFERGEDMRRRSSGVPVEAQRERDFASGQLGDFDERLAGQSRFARAAQFDPNGQFGPNDFQRRYNPQATAEWNQRMQEKIRQQAREDRAKYDEMQAQDRGTPLASSQWSDSADNLFDAKAERADLETRVKNYARQNGMSYDDALAALQAEPDSPFLALNKTLPGDRYTSLERKSGQRKRLGAQVDRRDEQALRRERIATAGLLGISQPQANAFLMLSPEDRNRAVNYITNPMAAKIDLARASNPPDGNEYNPLLAANAQVLGDKAIADAQTYAEELADEEGYWNPNDMQKRAATRSALEKRYEGNKPAQAAALAEFDRVWPAEGDPSRTPASGPRGAGYPTTPSGAPLPGAQ